MEYKAAPTLSKFHKDDTFVRAIIGPFGSGKSVACTVELLRRAILMPPDKGGVRRSRYAVIRNTYRELLDTTIRTFFQWIPEELCYFNRQELRVVFQFTHTDGTLVDVEWLFRALDKPDDLKKLLSLELTGAFVNECREVPLQIVEALMGRVGRFPRRQDVGDYFYFIIMDTNPMDVDHWFYRMFEERKPKEWKLFKQPSGLADNAENRANLPAKYYQTMSSGKTQEWINIYIHGQYGFVSDNKPVWPEFNDDTHSTQDDVYVGNDIVIGIDFGLTPAAAFIQQTATGRIEVFDELVTKDMGAVNFATLLLQKIAAQYSHCNIDFYADPAGDQRAQTDETTPFQILWAQGINAMPAPTNDWIKRREVVATYLGRLDFLGRPAFVVGPEARMIRKGLGGGYSYKRMQVVGQERYQDKPDKTSIYSHVCDALQYAVLGLVGDSSVVGGYDYQEIDYSVLNLGIV